MSIGSPTAKLASRAGCLALASACACAIAAAPALADGGVGNWHWLDPPTPPSGASFTVAAAPAGSPSSFDASASVASSGSITAYHWKFGDGTSADSSTPQISHVYASAGSYTTTLTETDTAVVSFFGSRYTRQILTAASTRSVVIDAPPPPPPPPPPAVHVSTSPVTVGPRGYAWIWISCPKAATGGCHGTLTIQLTRSGHTLSHGRRARAVESRCARGCRALGSGTYEARAGRRVHVRVHIASFARHLLRRQRRLRVHLTVTSVAGARSASTSATITLRARRRGHR